MAKRLFVGLAIGLGLLLVLDAIAVRAGLAPGIVPSLGSSAWTTSRAAGVTAFVALTIDVLFGLFVSTGAADAWIARARSVQAHKWLSAIALALTSVHALALSADRYVRFDALDVVVPFVSTHRPFAVGLGVLAAWAMLVVHASFDFVSRIGGYAWRKLHYLSFFVYAAATAHGVLAGSDSASPAMRALYLGSLGAVGVLVIARRRARATPSGGRRAST